MKIALSNKYTKWYCNIIEKSLIRKNENVNVKIEKHHIVPKSFNINSKDKNNIVQLTLREHYICHILLSKMFDDVILKTKMIYALWQMTNANRYDKIVNSRQYEYSRKMWLESRKNDTNISKKISEAHKGKKKNYRVWNKGKKGLLIHSEETKKKIGDFQRNRPDYLIEKMKKTAIENGKKIKGKKHEEIYGKKSKELKKKISLKMKGKTLEEILGVERAKIGKKLRSDAMSGKNNPAFGKNWINKNGKRKRIDSTELENYLNDGWIKGYKIK